ncbi:PGPGW domain-containing protein [Pseudoalteromonas piscicida]|uniref:PGPGW domain-containing protein n=1 Tax=Pseudoalteromonas piscicida TaxID=43662 RepID=UPI003099FDA4
MKIIYDTVGLLLCALALIFVIVPGPSVIFLLAALVCFSFNHNGAKRYLSKVQKWFKAGCEKLDKALQR